MEYKNTITYTRHWVSFEIMQSDRNIAEKIAQDTLIELKEYSLNFTEIDLGLSALSNKWIINKR